MYKIFKSGLAALLLLIAAISVQAQETTSVLYSEIQHAEIKGVAFPQFELFHVISGDKHDVLRNETLLSPITGAVSRLYDTHPAAVTIKLMDANGGIYRLKMLRSNPFAAGADVYYTDNAGDHKLNYDKGVHYQGAVDGAAQSMAALSVFANGDIMILFANADGNYVAGKLDDNSGNYILYNDRDFTVVPPTGCAAIDAMPAAGTGEPGTADKTTAAYGCKKLSLYWEIDYELYFSKLANVGITQTYVTGLFNNVQALYRNERIAVELKALKIWTVADGYADDSSRNALFDFQGKWNAQQDNFDGDIAMLLAKDKGGLGGIAFLDILCNRDRAYAYGDVNGSYSTIPTYSWDVSMVTHELGHNIASPHTHWCGWATGPGGTCGSIDNCVNQQSGGRDTANNICTTCPYQYDHAQPASAWQGTIMSYCHLSARGINLANGFGPLPADLMRTSINNASCLKSIISATLTATDVCKYSGFITVAFDSTEIGTSNFGTPAYTYKWSNFGTTQNVWINNPGNYSVVITDSNGCSNTFNITARQSTAEGCNEFTGIESMGGRQYVSLYPNPASNNVMLKFFDPTGQTATISIKDVTGRTVKQETLNTTKGENNINVDISGMQSGMYYILLSSPAQQYTGQKLMVK